METPVDRYSGLSAIETATPTHEDTVYAAINPSRATRVRSNVELSRIETLRVTQQETIGSGRPPEPPEKWLPFGGGKPHPPLLPHPDMYVVEFDGEHDPMHPHNWPTRTKYLAFPEFK